jgi:hypothetical protein
MSSSLEPEEIALLIAIGEHAPDGKVYEFDVDNVPTRKVICIGVLSFPPDLNNPGAPLMNQERWITALQSLRRRNFLTCYHNIYSVHGAGRQLMRRAKESSEEAWEAVNKCLRSLEKAQQAQINNPSEELNRKKVEMLTEELLVLCRGIQAAI